MKAASEIYAPLTGEIIAVNEALASYTETVNADPYTVWMLKLKPSNPTELDGLADATKYKNRDRSWGPSYRAQLPLFEATLLRLNRRTLNRAERTEHATIAGIRSQQCFAAGALIIKLTGVHRHGFLFREATTGTSQHGFKNERTH